MTKTYEFVGTVPIHLDGGRILDPNEDGTSQVFEAEIEEKQEKFFFDIGAICLSAPKPKPAPAVRVVAPVKDKE